MLILLKMLALEERPLGCSRSSDPTGQTPMELAPGAEALGPKRWLPSRTEPDAYCSNTFGQTQGKAERRSLHGQLCHVWGILAKPLSHIFFGREVECSAQPLRVMCKSN